MPRPECGRQIPESDVFTLVLDADTLACMEDEIAQDWPKAADRYELDQTNWFGSIIAVPLYDVGKVHRAGQTEGPGAIQALHQEHPRFQRPPGAANVPEKAFRWQDPAGKWMDPPEHQGYCGACVAFAVTAAVEATARIRQGKPDLPSLSESDLFFGGGGGCRSGWNLDVAMRYVEKTGILPKGAYPEPYDGFPQEHHDDVPGTRTRVKSWEIIQLEDIEDAVWWLRNRGPLIHESHVARDFFLYRDGLYRPKYDRDLLHAYCVIGYDRDRRAWHCRNSYGLGWGQSGTFWLPWDWGFIPEDRRKDRRIADREGAPFVGVKEFASIAGVAKKDLVAGP